VIQLPEGFESLSHRRITKAAKGCPTKEAMKPEDLETIRRFVETTDIDAISDAMLELVEKQWPELAAKLPPKEKGDQAFGLPHLRRKAVAILLGPETPRISLSCASV
jgi:hypothetical protein